MYTLTLAIFSVMLSPVVLAAEDKVNVTVYYESLCPDSQRFINSQLYETFKTPLVMYMNLVLVPYGNANTTSTGVYCQHGVVECFGNKIQACAIEKISMPDKEVGFINCLMAKAFGMKFNDSNTYKSSVITPCSNWTDQVDAIEQCAASPEGDSLIYIYGNMTKSAQPPIKGVPTIFFNGKSSPEINAAAAKDFTSELCNYISNRDKVHECSSGKGGATEIVSSIALVTFAIFLSRFH